MKKVYRYIFAELGYSDHEIEQRIESAFNTLFYGNEDERIYVPVGEDMGFITDTGNHDVRTEGMSYGMMMCVQLDKKEEFNRIWKWTKTHMYISSGKNAGYFCWSNALDGTKNSNGPAPDGEEFFAMTLIFAANRWGNGDGIFNYMQEAKELLRVMIHKGEDRTCGRPMFNPKNKLVKFVPDFEFTDPSYHLPHFYELFALHCYEEDADFWREAAEASRMYLRAACHKDTGLSPEYSDYDGTPHTGHAEIFGKHDLYYSDSYRTVANIALDYSWFGKDENEVQIACNLQKFFCETVKDCPDGIYSIDGTVMKGKALHPFAMIATTAQASLISNGPYVEECARKFWNTPLRSGDRRYYDNCLYLFALLALSGNYRMYA